jgi:hypothetical protein
VFITCWLRFVWGKKIERDLMMGKDVKEFTAAAVQRKHEERMVSSSSRERWQQQQQRAAVWHISLQTSHISMALIFVAGGATYKWCKAV